MLKAIIFDLDGLLVDSTPLQREASRLFVESFGKIFLPSPGREGMRMIDIIREYKDIFDLPGSLEELYYKRQQIYFDLVWEKLELFPDVISLVKKLNAKNYQLALTTSGDRDYVDVIFEKFPDLKKIFTVTITSEDVIRGKPAPDCYEKTLKKLGIRPNEAIVVEDSVNGILAAKAAGIQVICVPNRHYPDADYAIADLTFSSLREVETAIP